MIAIIFAKESERLRNKHSMDLCGEKMVDRVSRILLESKYFDKIILFTRDFKLGISNGVTVHDNTHGILIDSLIYCIEQYHEFLAVGGDMPFIDNDLIKCLMENYRHRSIAYFNNGYYQPLFAIYTNDIYENIKKYRMSGGESINRFMKEFNVPAVDGMQKKLASVNTMADLVNARKQLGCP
jgi:molybdopterin-guanine dinucleotide biosynthesis protein A